VSDAASTPPMLAAVSHRRLVARRSAVILK
jgi:hypothetical protein